jgi:hypothetical protein
MPKTRTATPRPIPGSLYTHPAASIMTGKIDGTIASTRPLPARLKCGRTTLKEIAAKTAVPTLKRLGSVL